MRKPFLLLTLGILFNYLSSCNLLKEEFTGPVIPIPTHAKKGEGKFVLTANTKIYLQYDQKESLPAVQFFVTMINQCSGFNLKIEDFIQTSASPEHILLQVGDAYSRLGTEGYRLSIQPDQILVQSNTPAGLFYGLQTLRQLLPAEIESTQPVSNISWQIPAYEIEDNPRFTWRGMHLDVCRHFFPKEFIKKYLDILALYKINIFHWHLTEDQGWRIEIKKYPKLTEVGAWRVDREDQNWEEREQQKPGEKATYGGFYTQEDIREIIQYAHERFITVIPEIEMPGHAVAALAAYPQYSCAGGPFTVLPGAYWPITNIYCAGNEETFTFLENILGEVCDLFPSEFVHIGGDEANKVNWKKCLKCQARIKSENLKDEGELQSYFIHRIEKFLNSKGKRLIGWDEILEGGLAPNATVMSWRGFNGGIAAANAGHDVVMAPTDFCYFDYYQAEADEPLAIGGFLPLEKVYEFEPVPPDIAKDKIHHILGGQANLWTEYIPTAGHAEYMLLPRLAALAEVVWSDTNRCDITNFKRRLETHFNRLTVMNVNFRVPPPEGLGGSTVVFQDTSVVITKPVENGQIRFTLDGSDPTPQSDIYTQPLPITQTSYIKAKTFLPGGRSSYPATKLYNRVDRERNGLDYRYYEGEWDSLPDVSILTPVRVGKSYDLNPAALPVPEKNYVLEFTTMLELLQDGLYTFYLESDDGSALWIDDQLLVKNDIGHGLLEKNGTVTLPAGVHQMKVVYQQKWGDAVLRLSYSGNGFGKQPVPANLYVYPVK